MLLVNTYIKPSPIHGTGLFAKELIPKGTVVWSFHKGLDMIMPVTTITGLPKVMQEFLGTYMASERGSCYIVLDNTRFINHSSSPNLDTGPGITAMVAAKDIQINEELTCDYRKFDDESRASTESWLVK